YVMPRKKEGQPVQVWMAATDRKRLDTTARSLGKTKSEFAREAIRAALDSVDRQKSIEKETEVARAIGHLENRLAGLIAKLAIVSGTVHNVLWQRTHPNDREHLFESA